MNYAMPNLLAICRAYTTIFSAPVCAASVISFIFYFFLWLDSRSGPTPLL